MSALTSDIINLRYVLIVNDVVSVTGVIRYCNSVTYFDSLSCKVHALISPWRFCMLFSHVGLGHQWSQMLLSITNIDDVRILTWLPTLPEVISQHISLGDFMWLTLATSMTSYHLTLRQMCHVDVIYCYTMNSLAVMASDWLPRIVLLSTHNYKICVHVTGFIVSSRITDTLWWQEITVPWLCSIGETTTRRHGHVTPWLMTWRHGSVTMLTPWRCSLVTMLWQDVTVPWQLSWWLVSVVFCA